MSVASTIEIVVKVNDQASAKAAEIEKTLRAIGDAASKSGGTPHGIEVPVKPKLDEGFEAEFERAMAEADKASESAARSIRGSFTSVESGSRSLRAAMAELEPAAGGAGEAIETAGSRASSGGSNASSAGASFAFLHSRMLMLAAGALALAPALAAIPAAMGAVAAGGALMTFGLGGVITALKDYGAQSEAAGESSAQMALTAFNNAVAIRNAEQAISDARHQAAIEAQNSADSVASAQERLANAQQSEQDATEALNQAWKDATNTLADLNNASADAANSVVDAQLALTRAQREAARITSSSLYTDDQKAEALQAVVDAQQHLTDAQQRALEAQQQADDANAKGVAGSTQVVQAQRAQTQAAQGVADAQKALVRAQQSAAESQRQSAEQVQKAVQNLSDTYKQQELAAAAAAASGGSAANKFAQDMANLTPAGQAFVKQLIAMKDGAKTLSQTAQTAMLPGLTQMLKDASPLLPTFNQALKDMGDVVGHTATSFGQLLSSPAFKGQLKQIFKDGADAAGSLGAAFTPMVGGIVQAASGAGPILKGLSDGLASIMSSGLPAFMSGLVSNSSGVGQGLSAFGSAISGALGPIGQLAGAVAGALGPALHDLAPMFVDLVTQLVQGLLPAISSGALPQALDGFVQLLGALLKILEPLIPIISQALVGALKILGPLLSGLAKFLEDNAGWLKYVAAGILALIFPMQSAVIAVLYLWDHFKGFRDFVHQMLADIHNWFFDAWHFINHIWQDLAEGTRVAWLLIKSYLINPIVDGYHFVVQKFDDIKTYIKGLPGELAKIGKGMWDWIATGIANVSAVVSGNFHTFVNGLIAGINWAIGYVNGATQKISDAWTWIPGAGGSGIPQIPPIPTWHAFGGVAGGLSAVIGDRGIELMRLPNGTQIMPAANTRTAIESGHGGNGPALIQIEWIGGNAGDEFLRWLRKNIRVIGGGGPNSVQRALGQTV